MTTLTASTPELLTPAEVALLFRVSVESVTRWANKGLLTSVKTPGNQHRFVRSEVVALLRASRQEAES